jgi:hypothetical protein
MARTTFKIRRIFSLSASNKIYRQSMTKLSLHIGSNWFAAQLVGEIFSQKSTLLSFLFILWSTSENQEGVSNVNKQVWDLPLI